MRDAEAGEALGYPELRGEAEVGEQAGGHTERETAQKEKAFNRGDIGQFTSMIVVSIPWVGLILCCTVTEYSALGLV